jgi:hypothetical protein
VLPYFISSRLDCGNALFYGLPEYQLKGHQKLHKYSHKDTKCTRICKHIINVLKSLTGYLYIIGLNSMYSVLTTHALHDQAPNYLKELQTIMICVHEAKS